MADGGQPVSPRWKKLLQHGFRIVVDAVTDPLDKNLDIAKRNSLQTLEGDEWRRRAKELEEEERRKHEEFIFQQTGLRPADFKRRPSASSFSASAGVATTAAGAAAAAATKPLVPLHTVTDDINDPFVLAAIGAGESLYDIDLTHIGEDDADSVLLAAAISADGEHEKDEMQVAIADSLAFKEKPMTASFPLIQNIGGFSCHMDASIVLISVVMLRQFEPCKPLHSHVARLIWKIMLSHGGEREHKMILDNLGVKGWGSARESIRNLMTAMDADLNHYIGFDVLTKRMPDGTNVREVSPAFIVLATQPNIDLQSQIDAHFQLLPHALEGPRAFLIIITSQSYNEHHFRANIDLQPINSPALRYRLMGVGSTPPKRHTEHHFVATVRNGQDCFATFDGYNVQQYKSFAEMARNLSGVRVDCWLFALDL